MGTEWAQKTVSLQAQSRGCHVVTKEIYKLVPELNEFDIGMCNIWRTLSLLPHSFFFVSRDSAGMTCSPHGT